jgi:hypothetical protein
MVSPLLPSCALHRLYLALCCTWLLLLLPLPLRLLLLLLPAGQAQACRHARQPAIC